MMFRHYWSHTYAKVAIVFIAGLLVDVGYVHEYLSLMIIGFALFIAILRDFNPYLSGLVFTAGLEVYYPINNTLLSLSHIGLSNLEIISILVARELCVAIVVLILTVVVHYLWSRDKKLILLLPFIMVVLTIIENNIMNYIVMFTLDFGLIFLGTIWQPLIPIIGDYGMQALLIMMALVVVFLAQKEKKLFLFSMVSLLVITLISLAQTQKDNGVGYTATAIQAIPQESIKFPTPNQVESLQRKAMSRYDKVKQNSDITVWPEGEVPDVVNMLQEKEHSLNKAVILAAKEYLQDEKTGHYKVKIGQYLFANSGTGFTAKKNLAPLGEYMPWYLKPFVKSQDVIESMSNEHRQPIQYGSQKIAGITCFDINDAWEVRQQVKLGATVIINSFSNSFYGKDGFLAANVDIRRAQMRAIETGRWMIRAGLGGVTGIIDNNGIITHKLPWWTNGSVTGIYKTRDEMTLFVKYGYVLNLLWLLPWLGIYLVSQFRGRETHA